MTTADVPQLDLLYRDELRDRFPEIVGGLSVAQARTLKILETEVKRPHSERAMSIPERPGSLFEAARFW